MEELTSTVTYTVVVPSVTLVVSSEVATTLFEKDLIDGYDFVDVPDAERLEITDPRGAGGKSRENEEQPGLGRDAANGSDGSGNTCHCPGKYEHHAGADGSRDVGVGMFDATFGQNRCDAGKECRCKRCNNPRHGCGASSRTTTPGLRCSSDDTACGYKSRAR